MVFDPPLTASGKGRRTLASPAPGLAEDTTGLSLAVQGSALPHAVRTLLSIHANIDLNPKPDRDTDPLTDAVHLPLFVGSGGSLT